MRAVQVMRFSTCGRPIREEVLLPLFQQRAHQVRLLRPSAPLIQRAIAPHMTSHGRHSATANMRGVVRGGGIGGGRGRGREQIVLCYRYGRAPAVPATPHCCPRLHGRQPSVHALDVQPLEQLVAAVRSSSTVIFTGIFVDRDHSNACNYCCLPLPQDAFKGNSAIAAVLQNACTVIAGAMHACWRPACCPQIALVCRVSSCTRRHGELQPQAVLERGTTSNDLNSNAVTRLRRPRTGCTETDRHQPACVGTARPPHGEQVGRRGGARTRPLDHARGTSSLIQWRIVGASSTRSRMPCWSSCSKA